jgi:hypothetical protein
MKLLNLFYLLPLVISSLVWSQASPVTCAGLQETPLPTQQCCQGLKLNQSTNLCEDPVQDLSLKACTTDSDCAAALPGKNTGCFPQTEDDLFSAEASNPNEFTPISDRQDTVDDDRDANPNEPVAAGQACVKSSDCISYACDPVSKLCLDKKICRLGYVGDILTSPGVKCEAGLVLTPEGKCDLSEQDKQLYFLGLIENDVELNTQRRCDFREHQNDLQMKEIREKSIVSMKTLRAMEWLFANSTLEESQECLKVLPYMREGMAIPFNAERKKILTNFNIEMAKIENDNMTLQSARETSTAMISIHGEAIKERDLATRRTSGYDAMKIMWRRNLLFQSYEKAMRDLIVAAGNKIGGLATEMANWTDNSLKWKVGDKEWTAATAGKCRGKKSKKIRKRWANYFQVNASSPANAEVVKSKTIVDYLALVNGDSVTSVTSTLVNGPKNTMFKNYFLIDPLMPGNKESASFDKFGSGKPSKRRLGDAAYPEIRQAFRESIQEFYKKMKGDGAPANFVYEPEIVKMEARDCIEKPDGPNCQLYSDFLEEMTDIAFAQFLAYSIHSENTYKLYFPKGDTMRRRLFAKYETDIQNVVKYYGSMITAREEQAKCLEDTMNQVVTDLIDDGPGVQLDTRGAAAAGGSSDGSPTSGAAVGTTATASGAANLNGVGGASRGDVASGSQLKSSLRVTQSSRVPFSADLRLGSMKNMTNFAKMDTLGAASSSSFASGNGFFSSGADDKQFAVNLNALKSANNTARAKGISLTSKEKITLAPLKNLAHSFSVTTNPTQVASNGLGSGVAGLEVTPANSGNDPGAEPRGKMIESGNAHSAAVNTADVFPKPVFSEGNSQYKTLGSTPVSTSDQEIIEASYQRMRGEYASDEEDPLFSKVSKAYVRNLDKILKKKKKIEE